MPKKVPEQELDAIIRVIEKYPDGIRTPDIAKKLDFELDTRTLQRRLVSLVNQDQIIAQGAGRGRRYQLPDRSVQGSGDMSVKPGEETESYPPLSSGAELIRQAIRLPIQERVPVGYERKFLDSYRPNRTSYLAEEIRSSLSGLGRAFDVPLPAGTYARQIYSRLLIDLSWNSSRLEGNTYSLLETERLLQLGESADGKDARDAQMILNHKAAIELIVEQVDEIGLNRYTILNLHALLSDNLLADPGACGRLRSITVGVHGTVFHPLDVPQLIAETFDQVLNTAAAIRDPFEQAFFLMVHIPYLQPFEDVNKRVSRLAANIPLIRENLCPLSFIDVPEQAYVEGTLAVYEQQQTELLRDVFVWAYERSSARYSAVRKSLGQPDPFKTRYRQEITEVIQEVVRKRLDKKAATVLVQDSSRHDIDPGDRNRFIEVVETELMNMHEGNIARYRIRAAEYSSWQEWWNV